MRTMNTEKLIKTLPIIQNQLDALLDFQVSSVFVCDARLLLYTCRRCGWLTFSSKCKLKQELSQSSQVQGANHGDGFHILVCACRGKMGIGSGFAEIGGCIVVCSRELRKAKQEEWWKFIRLLIEWLCVLLGSVVGVCFKPRGGWHDLEEVVCGYTEQDVFFSSTAVERCDSPSLFSAGQS